MLQYPNDPPPYPVGEVSKLWADLRGLCKGNWRLHEFYWCASSSLIRWVTWCSLRALRAFWRSRADARSSHSDFISAAPSSASASTCDWRTVSRWASTARAYSCHNLLHSLQSRGSVIE